MIEAVASMIYLHIIKSTVSHGTLDGIIWIGLYAVKTVQNKSRIHVTETLPTHIAQV